MYEFVKFWKFLGFNFFYFVDHSDFFKIRTFKGTVAREKLLNWGLGEMDWTLTIDCTWVLHFPDQLFKCYNILTVCRL